MRSPSHANGGGGSDGVLERGGEACVALAMLTNSLRQGSARDSGNRSFAGGIDVEDGDGGGVGECGREAVHEKLGARVAMRLENDVDTGEPGLLGAESVARISVGWWP